MNEKPLVRFSCSILVCNHVQTVDNGLCYNTVYLSNKPLHITLVCSHPLGAQVFKQGSNACCAFLLTFPKDLVECIQIVVAHILCFVASYFLTWCLGCFPGLLRSWWCYSHHPSHALWSSSLKFWYTHLLEN